jgi:hypothetical protein
MRTSFIFFFHFSLSIGNPLFSQQLEWKIMKNLNFDLSIEAYKSDEIHFYHALIDKASSVATNDGRFSLSKDAAPLDIYSHWNKKGEEDYDVFFTKTGYVLDAPITFFTKERLSDTGYIAKTMPEAKVSHQDSTYHLAMGFEAPDIDYSLKFYTNDAFESTFPALIPYFSNNDGFLETPELIVVQYNFNYGRVMFQKTSKMSISISRYFAQDTAHTLVLNYTLNYIHNMPPKFIGGTDFLLDKIKEGIKALIEETQIVCRKER